MLLGNLARGIFPVKFANKSCQGKEVAGACAFIRMNVHLSNVKEWKDFVILKLTFILVSADVKTPHT